MSPVEYETLGPVAGPIVWHIVDFLNQSRHAFMINVASMPSAEKLIGLTGHSLAALRMWCSGGEAQSSCREVPLNDVLEALPVGC